MHNTHQKKVMRFQYTTYSLKVSFVNFACNFYYDKVNVFMSNFPVEGRKFTQNLSHWYSLYLPVNNITELISLGHYLYVSYLCKHQVCQSLPNRHPCHTAWINQSFDWLFSYSCCWAYLQFIINEYKSLFVTIQRKFELKLQISSHLLLML